MAQLAQHAHFRPAIWCWDGEVILLDETPLTSSNNLVNNVVDKFVEDLFGILV